MLRYIDSWLNFNSFPSFLSFFPLFLSHPPSHSSSSSLFAYFFLSFLPSSSPSFLLLLPRFLPSLSSLLPLFPSFIHFFPFFRIYADIVINHMTGWHPTNTPGTGGSSFDAGTESYPGVPYSGFDFNDGSCHTESGNIENYNDANQVCMCVCVCVRVNL